MAGTSVVVFVNAGRCGTQWLAAGLRELYPRFEVEHEPIGPRYRPRTYFRRYSDPEAILEVPEVASHVRRIARCRRPYIETGWPLFPVVPLLAREMPDRLRIVHLTRHPVPSALAHLAHKSYAGSPRDDAYTRMATLGPEDPCVFQDSYTSCWDQLTPYEKCLFWWTEVHLFGLELPGRVQAVPLLRIKAEDILAGRREALQELLDFMQVPWRDEWDDRSSQLVDRWHQGDDGVDPLEVHRHPTTIETARQLGYRVGEFSVSELEAHYRGEPDSALDRLGRYA